MQGFLEVYSAPIWKMFKSLYIEKDTECNYGKKRGKWSKQTTLCQIIPPANMGLCPISSSECLEASWWDITHCKIWDHVIMILTDPSWAESEVGVSLWTESGTDSLSAFLSSSLGKQKSAFPAQILQLKRLKLTWISVSVTMASCSAVLPTASRWHLSGTSSCGNALSSYPSGSHIVISWSCSKVFLLCKQQKGINNALFSHYCLLGKLYGANLLCASVPACVKLCGRLESKHSGKESRSRMDGFLSLFTT